MTGTVPARVEAYIVLRRGLGYRSPSQERALRAFGRHLDQGGHEGPIGLESSLDWATKTTSTDPCSPARRLTTVRGFLRHLAVIDGATEVPEPGLLGSTGHRKPPHIYSEVEISALLASAAWLAPAGGLRPRCYVALLGLLACTGLRISEALSLRIGDVDLDHAVLTIRSGKHGRTRLVPLHPSAVPQLADYANHRRRRYGPPGQDAAFFRTDRSDQMRDSAAHHAFSVLRRQLVWTTTGRVRAPHIHDLRHPMVVRRIQAWHTEGVNVDANIAVLATYLGHVEVRDLYWYLSAVPELMGTVADRFEAFARHSPEDAS